MKRIREPKVTTDLSADDQLLYFTSSSLVSSDDILVFLSNRTGEPNIFYRDLISGEEKRLTFNTDGYMKTYVYFDGNERRGLGKASISLDPINRMVYFIQGLNVCRVSLDGEVEILATLPEDQVTAFTHVSQSGNRLCVPTTDARALDCGALTNNKPDYDIDQRVRDENLSSYLRVYDTNTGKLLFVEEVPQAWVTHVQFSPFNEELILYNHEWPSDCGIRRAWLWNGSEHIRLRNEGQGRQKEDWVCHEMWLREKEEIIYHGIYKDGAGFLGKVGIGGEDNIEIEFPPEFRKYGHFTVGNANHLVSDGYYQESEGNHRNGEWLSVQNVDWENRTITWTPIAKHGSNWDSQDSHPHPIFSHSGDVIYFTSNKDGKLGVYSVKAW